MIPNLNQMHRLFVAILFLLFLLLTLFSTKANADNVDQQNQNNNQETTDASYNDRFTINDMINFRQVRLMQPKLVDPNRRRDLGYLIKSNNQASMGIIHNNNKNNAERELDEDSVRRILGGGSTISPTKKPTPSKAPTTGSPTTTDQCLIGLPRIGAGMRSPTCCNTEEDRYSAGQVALTPDGHMLLVASYYEPNSPGAVYVYIRNALGTSFTLSATIIPNDSPSTIPINFGASISLSPPDVNGFMTLAVTGNFFDGTQGAVWVFKYSPQTDLWTQDGPVIIPSDLVPSELSYLRFGASCAISDAGNVLAVSATFGDVSGAIWIFTRTNSVLNSGQPWIQSGPRITVGSAYEFFGDTVQMDSTGTVLVTNAISTSPPQYYSTFVYEQGESGLWYQVGDIIGASMLGTGLHLTPDGLTLFCENGNQLQIKVYTRSSKGKKFNPTPSYYIFPNDVDPSASWNGFGQTMATTGSLATGLRVAVGSPYEGARVAYAPPGYPYPGAVRVFAFDPNALPLQFVQEDSAVSIPGTTYLGHSVAISSVGTLALGATAYLFNATGNGYMQGGLFVLGC